MTKAQIEKELKELRDGLEYVPAEHKASVEKTIKDLEKQLAEKVGAAAKPAIDKIAKKAYTKFKKNDIVVHTGEALKDDPKLSGVEFEVYGQPTTLTGDNGEDILAYDLKRISDGKLGFLSAEYVLKKASTSSDKKEIVDWDCDDLIEKEKAKLKKRKTAAKKRDKKTEKTKNNERVDKVVEIVEDGIKDRISKGKPVTKAEVEGLIRRYEEAIADLNKILKTL